MQEIHFIISILLGDYMKLRNEKVYLLNNSELVSENEYQNKKPDDYKGTMAYKILSAHNTSGNDEKLNIRFDALTSHDITYVGIIQTARASGLTSFPMPYVLTNCHNSLCAVGGTINEDDHLFGLSAARKYGGIYVPAHQAVIHQYAREMSAKVGAMILGSDSHTRYGALGTMAIGEGGPELVKQLLKQTYDIDYPEVVGIYLTGKVRHGVGPQDVALNIIKEVFKNGFVKNKVMEFVGPGLKNLSADFRIGVDVMTTETTCLSSIWATDDEIKDFYRIHGRDEDFYELRPDDVALYDSMIELDLSEIKPSIALPFHPSNVYAIDELNANLEDILKDVEDKAKISLGDKVEFNLRNKIHDGKLLVDQAVIAGCAGGGYENICAAADVLSQSEIGNDAFNLSIYPASMPVYMQLIKNGAAEKLIGAGAVIKTAFCGPCFGAGDTPANNAFSIRHSTRNFPNREGSKIQNGQISSVALMDARSIAATAANHGYLTSAEYFDGEFNKYQYFFDSKIYERRVFDSKGVADEKCELVLGPNIKDWPKMSALPENLVLKVVSEIHDPVTTTDELIPSGETSSYRSNPLGLAEFTLSRKDPEYVGLAKEIKKVEEARTRGEHPCQYGEWVKPVMHTIKDNGFDVSKDNTGFGSTIYAVKPGDGSAREQAASCQKVLGGWANIASEYATKRYRSNLINWGMLPFIYKDELCFHKGDFIFIPGIREVVENKVSEFNAYVVDYENKTLKEFKLSLSDMTDRERQIILKGCLINYNRVS